MEYPDAERLVFDSALTGAKNILGDLAVAIVALISILLIVYAISWLRGIFSQHKTEEKSGEDYKKVQLLQERKLTEKD